ncbi:hypothetical protein ACROYT_G016244 [Oculina patagonica]
MVKLLAIVLVSTSILYFALIAGRNGSRDEGTKPEQTVSSDSNGNFSEEVQQTNDTRPEGERKRQQTVTSDSGGNFTEGVQQINDTRREEGKKGKLTVSIWRDVCGGKVKVLKNSPFYPSYPDEKKFIHEFQIEDNKLEYGQTITGFIHPANSGFFRFATASDDSSELWLSSSEDPEEKQLIARVFTEDSIGWTKKNELDKYPNQVSRDVELRNGSRYYIEVIHKQGAGDGFVQVFWVRPGDADFQLISAEYLSSYSDDFVGATKVDAMNKLLAKRLAVSEKKWKKYSNFFPLPLISKGNYLPPCAYQTSFIVKEKIDKENGVHLVYLSNVFPQDDTFMGNKGNVWSWSNRVADKEIIQSVVDKMIASLCRKTAKEYFLKRIHKVIQKSDPVYGDRFSVDVEVGLNHSRKSFRLSEHVYQKKGSDKLCFPEGFNWNSNATVYFILPVKDQGRWVYHFINELTVASLLTGDTNFHVIVVDFESQDIDMAKAFNTSLLHSRHTIVNLSGKFYKTLAINEAVARVPSDHDLLFLFDLHIDVPADIMDSVRKNTIEGRVAYFPAVGRLDCGSTHADHRGFWQLNGYGLLGVYKSDWAKFGGMDSEKFKYKWGGEDWDLLDRVFNAQLEVERIKYPGLYHHYHSKKGKWR